MMLLLWVSFAVATPADIQRCLEANDVPCAKREVQSIQAESSADGDVLALAANTRFYAGEYEEALSLMQKAVAAGHQDRWDDLGLYERTALVMADWAEVRDADFVVRYRPGMDAILLEEARETLSSTRKNLSPLMGGQPSGPVILEIYPDGRSFTAASSLTEKDVQTTGVVALSKWSRLLLTSPRALGRGYEWKDTVAHEYIHRMVSQYTEDQAPVWLQEAIAKYLDNRWRDGKDHFHLGPRDEGLLARAIREEGTPPGPDDDPNAHRGLVSFDQMHPSLAKLPTAEMAALAYAQLASLMSYCFEKGGEDVLVRVLPRVKQGVDPRIALAEGAGAANFGALEKEWLEWLKKQKLQDREAEELPTVLDGANEAESDPVLSGREDLQRWMRLGDLLREKGHAKAALVEYAKAYNPEEPPSPLLANRVAQAHLALGDLAAARASLEESREVYPEFALTHKTLGQIFKEQKQVRAALDSFRRAADLNPFDPEVQQALASLYSQTGDSAGAARHERYMRILRRGGPEAGEVTLIREMQTSEP